MVKKSLDAFDKGMELAMSQIERAIDIATEKSVGPADPEEQAKIDSELKQIKAGLRLEFPTYESLLTAAAHQKFIIDEQKRNNKLATAVRDDFLEKFKVMSSSFASELLSYDALPSVEEVLSTKFPELASKVEEMATNRFARLSELTHAKAKLDSRKALSENGAKGREKRDEKKVSLQEKALSMANAGKYKSRRQAAYEIAKQLVDTAEFRNSGLKEYNAPNTVATWLAKAGVRFSED